MSARSIRRAAERKAQKLAAKAARQSSTAQPQPTAAEQQPEIETQPKSPLSEARLSANRENAQKSCGPSSPEGKAKASLNSLKHGLTGKFLLFSTAEEADLYKQHVASYDTQFQPIGPEETALVRSIADIRWRLNQIPGLEMALLTMGRTAFLIENPNFADRQAETIVDLRVREIHEKEFRNLHLTENRLARRRERETAELMRLQAERRVKEEEFLAEAAKVSVLAKHRNQPLPNVPGLGFVFSEKRFAGYMSRLTPTQREKFLEEAMAREAETLQTMEAAA